MFNFKKINSFLQSSKKTKVIRKSLKKSILTDTIFHQTISEKVPHNAVEYCTSLWREHPFSFSISKTRSTCLGNYKYQNGSHTITINHDLNAYNFLITFIHEVAHQRVFIQFQSKIRKRPLPHGKEWKTNFQYLITPLLNETIFPLEVLQPLASHMAKPPASSTRDPKLMKALKQYDLGDKTGIWHLEDMANGQSFVFKNRTFLKIDKRRTRALCLDLATKKRYTIPLMAEVKPILE
jgi:SprT protein